MANRLTGIGAVIDTAGSAFALNFPVASLLISNTTGTNPVDITLTENSVVVLSAVIPANTCVAVPMGGVTLGTVTLAGAVTVNVFKQAR